MRPQNDIGQTPDAPQYQLGATTSDAVMANETANNKIGPPGDIVARLGQQFQIPRAEPDADISRRPGMNLGES